MCSPAVSLPPVPAVYPAVALVFGNILPLAAAVYPGVALVFGDILPLAAAVLPTLDRWVDPCDDFRLSSKPQR